MEKLLKYFLSVLIFSSIVSCSSSTKDYYKKEIPLENRTNLSDQLINGLGNYYQGTVSQQVLLEEVEIYNNEHAELWRERGIPYLKRGMAWGYLPNYSKCVKYDSVGWQGYRGYCTLYFYRDYERALKDFDELDVLTPNFTDYPQSTSIDYMRGICYLGLEQPQKALEYFEKHIETEAKQVGYDYIYSVTYILKGICLKKLGRIKEAQETFEFGIKQHEKNADLEFQLAKILHEQGEDEIALKWLTKANKSFLAGYSNNRPYVEEFYQVYMADLEDLENEILVKGIDKSKSI